MTPSEQLGARQVPPEQTPLAQSLGTPQVWPSAQLPQAPPPQSTSVSAPFLTPSEHAGARQVPPEQTPLAQSAPARQATQAPAPSHRIPPDEAHAVPAGFGSWAGAPAWQTPVEQSLLAEGTSVASAARITWPVASHWLERQSPVVGSEILVPAVRGSCAHWPAAQAAIRQGADGAGQVVASVQAGFGELEPQADSSRRSREPTRRAGRASRKEPPGGGACRAVPVALPGPSKRVRQ